MLIDIGEFQRLLAQKGFQIVEQENRSLPAGKALWFGIFSHAPNLCRRESGFCGRMVERPRQLAAAIDVAHRVSVDQGKRARLDRDCAGRWRSWRGNGGLSLHRVAVFVEC